mgnify:CR=1 FL=1
MQRANPAALSKAEMLRNTTPLTYQEKQMLKANIFKLDENTLGKLVDIIAAHSPNMVRTSPSCALQLSEWLVPLFAG